MAQKRSRQNTRRKLPDNELERLTEEATVDAYGESEQATGFLTMLEEHVELPFETEILGAIAKVVQFDIDNGDQIIAICERGGHKQTIQLVALPLPAHRPQGVEWIAA